MADAARARKLGERFQEIVAETLELKVKDPRLGFVTVTSVRVSADLREATVFYTVFGDEAEATNSAAALDSSKGLVRSEIGKRTGIKFTPTVEFDVGNFMDKTFTTYRKTKAFNETIFFRWNPFNLVNKHFTRNTD